MNHDFKVGDTVVRVERDNGETGAKVGTVATVAKIITPSIIGVVYPGYYPDRADREVESWLVVHSEKVKENNVDVNSIDYKIAVMQAYKEGKSIEYNKPTSRVDWTPIASPSWDWCRCNYRIKEEPKEDWLVEFKDSVSGKWKSYHLLTEYTEQATKKFIEISKMHYTIPPQFRYRRIEPAKD